MAQKKFIIDGGFSTNAESLITGNLVMTGSILPSVDSNGVTGYDLGAPDKKWRDLYLSEGSLYIDGQKVLQSDSGTIVVSADLDQSLLTKTTGAGVLTFQSPNPIAISGTLQMGTGKRITSADGLAVVFGDKIDMDANQIINVANPTSAQHVATKDYVDNAVGDILNGAPAALDTLNELADALGNDANFAATVTNALALKAATTYVDAQDTATLNAAKAYSDSLAFGQGADLSTTNSRVSTNELEIDALQADMATAQADILANASDIADNAAAITAAISTASSDATTKADAALESANAYTDGREVAITSAYTAAITAAVEAQDEINELADVNITSVANGQFLRYDLGSNKWVNVTANTTMIAEGTKLFFTDARAQTAVAGDIASAVAAETSAREAADALLQTQIDFIKENTDGAALDSLTELLAAFQTADGDLLTTVNANTSAINAEVTRATGAETTLQSNIDTVAGDLASEATRATGAEADLQDAIDVVAAGLTTEISARGTADTTLQSNIDAVAGDLATESAARASGDATTLASAQSYADQAEVDAKAYTDARETAITTAYQSYADQAEVDAKAYADSVVTAEASSRASGDATTLASAQSYADGIVAALSSSVSADVAALTSDDVAEGSNLYFTDARAQAAVASDIADAVAVETARIDAILLAADADKNSFAEIVTFINAVDTTNDTALGTEITTRAAADLALQTNIDSEASARASADTALAGDIASNTTAISNEVTRASGAEASLQSAINDLALEVISRDETVVSDLQAYADQAEADAKTYTDGRETAITTAYQSYADQAEADAKTYTDGRETAITTAYTLAIATAKAESDAYADQAEADAKTYTDGRETAITTAYQSYADTAEADAKSYADGIVSSEATARQIADTGLQDDLSTETAARISGDAALQAQIDQNASDIGGIEVDLPTNYVAKTSTQALHATDALRFGANTLSLYKGDGTFETVDLSIYADDTNLARIVSGTMAPNGIATFTRDDNTSFTVDMSILLDDTNLSRIVSAGWNTGNGVLTLTRNDATTVTVDLDDRYSLTSHNHTLDSLSNVSISANTNGEILRWNGSDWVNNTLAEAGIQAAGSYAAASHTHAFADLTGKPTTLSGYGITDAMTATAISAEIATKLDASAEAVSAAKLTDARTIALSGDVTGSASFDGSANVTISATIAANSVALGTDTTGNYAGAVAAGAGITVSGTAGEGTIFTVAHADTSTVANVSSNNSNGVVIQDVALAFDTYGHVTAATVATANLDNRYVQPSQLTHFHSAAQTVTQAQSNTNNGVGTTAAAVPFTFADLSTAKHYVVFLNRIMLRPSEYTVSGTTVTIAVGLLASDDEIEVTGLKL